MKKSIFVFLAFLFAHVSVFAVPAAAIEKVVAATVKTAAKKSGKALTPAMKVAAEKALLTATKQYGDDVLKVVSHGGLEALEQGAKHGKVFWKLCAHAPQAARSLALHADDLLPIARRVGPEFMKLEAHVPGLAKEAVTHFGDDAVKVITKMPVDDAAKLIKFGMKADSPSTAKLLFTACRKTGGAVLNHLSPGKIVACGLTAAAITAAYKVGDGASEALKTTAETAPEAVARPLFWSLIAMAAMCGSVVLWVFFPVCKGLHAKLVHHFARP